MDFGIASVAAITVICLLIGKTVKVTNRVTDEWIPIACGISGLILGLIALYIEMPDFPATDPVTAAAVGVVSGLAATGVNQIYKQLN